MYQIKLGDYILYDIREKELNVENPQLELEVNKVGNLKFSIYPDHPYFDRIKKLSSIITVLKDKKTIFKSRIITDEQGIYNNKNIECEGVLGYLNDSIVRPYSFNGTPAQHFTNLFNNHNSQVAEEQKLKIGTITVTDPNDYIVRSSGDYASTWDILNEDLINKLGGYLRVRYESDGTYVDYLEDFEDTSTQVIEFGENLIDVLVKNDATNVYTAVIPLGAEIENADGTAERLTIKSVNNGLDYLVNQEAYNQYGLIFAPVSETTWEDVTLPSNLLTKGRNYLNNQAVMLKSTFECKAIDLNVTDEQIERFFIYEYVRFKSEIHNINQTYLLEKISIPLHQPENMQITLGEETSSLTGIQMGNKKNTDSLINRVGKVEKDYTLNQEKINDLENSINYFSVDLSQYNISIPVNIEKKPIEAKNYDVNFYGYFKGQQITPSVSISGNNTGITASKTNTYIRFAVNNNTAIANTLNEYTITFTYTAEGETYTTKKIIDIVLATQGEKGADGTGVTILGSYNSYDELVQAHPTGEPGDSYLINGDLYVWSSDTNSWEDVGNIQGPAGPTGSPGAPGEDGKSAYQIWLDAGNTGTEAEYLASLKGDTGPEGPQGIPGVTGKDGVSYYFYVKYSANSNGNPMTNAPVEGSTKYMGVASTTSNTAPTSYTAYTWSLIKGEDGADGSPGSPGQPGADGKSSYLHIKYSDDGTTFTANSGETPGRYRGELVDENLTDSTTFSDYKWYDMSLIVEEELDEIRQEVVNNTSLIEQTDEQIRLDVASEYVSTGTFDEFKQQTNTQFTVQADGIETKFSEVTLLVAEVEEEIQAQYRELTSYISGYQNEEGQPVIELGANTSNINLKLLNDRIQFLQNGSEVAYISNNTLYITDGTFLNSLRIGQFAFIPRANGSLDFKKVVM